MNTLLAPTEDARQRRQLYRKVILEGEQPIELHYAARELFRDIPLSVWCRQVGLQYTLDYTCDNRIFLNFSEPLEEEL